MRLPRPLLAAVVRHAFETYPEECCGVLVGRGERVARVMPARNTAEEPRRRYFAAPEDLVAAQREARESGLAVLGYYHSHPGRDARPSEVDLEHARPEVSYLVVAVAAGEVTEIRSWRLDAGGRRFAEEPLELDEVTSPHPEPD